MQHPSRAYPHIIIEADPIVKYFFAVFHEIFHVFSAFSTKILRAAAAPTFCVQPQAQPHDFDPPVPVSGQEKIMNLKLHKMQIGINNGLVVLQ